MFAEFCDRTYTHMAVFNHLTANESMDSSKKAYFWSERETIVMLRIMKEMDIMKCL